MLSPLKIGKVVENSSRPNLTKNMLVIRLFRIGKKNQPSFRLVITDKRKSSTKGRSIEEVGFWNPLTKEKVLKGERIKYWLSVGAKPSDTVHNLLVKEKILVGKKIPKHKKPKKVPEGEKPSAVPAKPVAEPPASAKATAGEEKESAPKEDAAGKPASAKATAGKEATVGKEEKTEGEKEKETIQKIGQGRTLSGKEEKEKETVQKPAETK